MRIQIYGEVCLMLMMLGCLFCLVLLSGDPLRYWLLLYAVIHSNILLTSTEIFAVLLLRTLDLS